MGNDIVCYIERLDPDTSDTLLDPDTLCDRKNSPVTMKVRGDA